MSMKLRSTLASRIEAEIARLAPEAIGHVDYEGKRYHALPVFGTIGEVWLLRSDGSLWKVDSDSGLELQPLPEALHTTALVSGAERYPWLGELLPRRPPDAIECASCGGLGRIGPAGAIFCPRCDALGWLPPSKEP